MKAVTIQDIARVAGVSKSTVSRVLNGTAKVHPEKEKAVRDATDRLGFRPNVVARSLARGRSMTIGVLTQMIGSPFYDTIAQGVIAALDDTGYSPIFADGRWERNEEVSAIRALVGRRVDGLVLIGGAVPAAEISVLCENLPVIIVGRDLSQSGHHCISMDNVNAAFAATQHLIEHGHRRIATIAGVRHHPDAIDRLAGYSAALRAAGIEPDPRLMLSGDFTAESGVHGTNELIARGAPFTAIFAANDMTAFGARLALSRAGLRVPEDISVVGFDDQMESAYMTPPLTTIRQPAREMGELASRAVLSLIEGQSWESAVLTGELQVRESVARRRD